jgi:hypothetical protein
MFFIILARITFLVHFAFILFVPLGGLLAVKWKHCPWLHVPSAVYGALLSFFGWICPLTPLESWLLEKGGRTGYHCGFIEHYIVPIIYPEGLTRNLGITLGVAAVVINLIIYTWLMRKSRHE